MENAAPDSMFVQWQRFMAGQEVDRRIVKPMVYDSSGPFPCLRGPA